MTTERKEGFYWVKQIDHPSDEYWEIGEWDGFVWLITGEEDQHESLSVVGDRIPAPGEGWRAVPEEATREMQYAVEETSLPDFCSSSRQARHHELGAQVYRAMVAAAPKPGGGHEAS